MKTYDERYESIASKIEILEKVQRRKSAVIVGCQMLLLLAVVLIPMIVLMLIPYKVELPDVSMYADSPYYSLIQRINEATTSKPKYKNYFEVVIDYFSGKKSTLSNVYYNYMADSRLEITDNQVEGVIEADIIKRSNKYIYYLCDKELRIYSIEGPESKEVGHCSINEEAPWTDTGYWEMYLSQDGNTVTVIGTCEIDRKYRTRVVNLDVSDPTDVREIGRIYISGLVRTSRMVDNKLLLMSRFWIPSDKDFSVESTYLPQIGQPGNMISVAPEDIVVPEEINDTGYTVVCMLDGKTLAVYDSTAYLSYSGSIHVSENHIFLTRNFTRKGDGYDHWPMTEIACLSYREETLGRKGSVTVDGSLKDQYSMHEHEGILRVVTSVIKRTEDAYGKIRPTLDQNASLYCVSLADFSIVASVEKFAPAGEQAASVRFDGDYAYVCTAKIYERTDPVYFFDLSDLDNITYKDTGTIKGYSSSLVNFGDGYLLGIGYSGTDDLKIEVYKEEKESIVSVCSYEKEVSFSENYKSYFIDRENHLIGLGIRDRSTKECQYILLRFDGHTLQKMVEVPMGKNECEMMRAVLIDNYLYVVSPHFSEEGFQVVQVG